MKNNVPALSLALTLLALSACSPDREKPIDDAVVETGATTSAEPSQSEMIPPDYDTAVLRLEGLGDLTIGKSIPAGSTWAVRGAQVSETCQTASSPDYPGAYAIVSGNSVRRITISDDSDVKLTEGIAPGATEEEVMTEFPGFTASPHKYVDAPAKYLTQPGDDPRLRFEIESNGKVSLVHVGVMPELGYVEGCA